MILKCFISCKAAAVVIVISVLAVALFLLLICNVSIVLKQSCAETSTVGQLQNAHTGFHLSAEAGLKHSYFEKPSRQFCCCAPLLKTIRFILYSHTSDFLDPNVF